MISATNAPLTSGQLERAADEILQKTKNHNALTETQMRRRARHQHCQLAKYITQNNTAAEALNYLRRTELLNMAAHAQLTRQQARLFACLMRDLTVPEAGHFLGVKRSNAYQLYKILITKLRIAAQTAPYTGLAAVYCTQVIRYPCRKCRFQNHDPADLDPDYLL